MTLTNFRFRSFLDRMSDAESNELQLIFAEAVYGTGQSFNVVTNDLWKKFFKRLRPKFVMPTRKALANELLDSIHDKVSKMTNAFMDKSDYISLVVDGWTNVRKDAIINIIAMTPSPVFLKSIDTKGATKDVKFMFNLLKPIIEELKPKKVNGLISDNEPKMIALSRAIIKEYKHVTFSGCVAHKLHNLIKQLIEIGPIKKLITDAENIVKEFKNHHSLHAKYRDLMKADKIKSFGELKLYAKTRFSGTVFMLESVSKAMNALRTIASDPASDVSEDTKRKLLAIGGYQDFHLHLNQLYNFLKPYRNSIAKIENDKYSIADMIECIKKIEVAFKMDISFTDKQTKEEITKLINDSIKEMKMPSALLANVLHPKYHGKSLSNADKGMATTFLQLYAKNLDLDSKRAMTSYQQYVNSEMFFSQPFLLSLDMDNGISWWKFVSNLSDHMEISEIAIRLLHIQPTNTAVERSFSRQKHIHSKERNRLGSEIVNKLMFVHSNMKTFNNDENFNENDYVLESDIDSSSESEEEDITMIEIN